MTRQVWTHLLAAALMLTLLNALKPVTMDDPSYLSHARQVAEHPLDPYGGEMFMYQTYGPALDNNAPPVSIYWLAAGVRVLGASAIALKLWLLTWGVALAFALYALLHRMAPGVALPFTWVIMFSPWVLPGFNFMLDVPVTAMGLAAIALFARAADRNSTRDALLAGLIAGLAIQTKYTGALAPAAILAYGLVTRRFRLALIACTMGGALAVGWEVLMYARYGDTPLLHYLGRRERGESGVPRVDLILPLLRHAGMLGAGLVPLGLAALGASRRTVLAAMAAVAVGWASFAWLPGAAVAFFDGLAGSRFIDFDNVTLGPAALAALVLAAVALWRTGRRREPLDVFLLAWLAIEIAGYLLITTSPAARRVMGMLLVATLMIARLAASGGTSRPGGRTVLRAAVVFSVMFGLAFWWIDYDNARAQRDDVHRVLDRIDSAHSGAPGAGTPVVWYVGTHFGGFQYYAPQSGMKPVLPGRSVLHAGDWLVIPLFVEESDLRLDPSMFQREATLGADLRLPVTTRSAYYVGGRPLRRTRPDKTSARIYRVMGDGVADIVKPGTS